VSQILSYAILEASNKTPGEHLADVLPALGIDTGSSANYDWMVNKDGMEYGYHGLVMTAEQMAKFGQLYL